MNDFADALAIAPQIAFHHRIPGSLRRFPRFDEVRELVERALVREPASAEAHATLGNILMRIDQGEALAAYRDALELDPDYAEAHLAVAEILHGIADDDGAERHLRAALAKKVLYSAVPPDFLRSLLVLSAPRPWSANVPLDFILDDERNAVHRCYIVDGNIPAPMELPAYDLVWNAIGEAEDARPTILAAERFIAAQTKPAINAPRALERTARPALAATLREIDGCVVPRTVRLQRSAVNARVLGLPFLIRPVDSHGGRELALIDTPQSLGDYLEAHDAAHDGDRFDLTEFVDYRDADVFYRKYRVVFVDGTPFPYHLALSPGWMIHYYKTPMREQAWMRAEEERFLADPGSAFPGWDQTFPGIAESIGLDFFGIDCARAADGSVIVFEADAATLVHCLDPLEVFPYKHRFVSRIFDAVEAMLARRSGLS